MPYPGSFDKNLQTHVRQPEHIIPDALTQGPHPVIRLCPRKPSDQTVATMIEGVHSIEVLVYFLGELTVHPFAVLIEFPEFTIHRLHAGVRFKVIIHGKSPGGMFPYYSIPGRTRGCVFCWGKLLD